MVSIAFTVHLPLTRQASAPPLVRRPGIFVRPLASSRHSRTQMQANRPPAVPSAGASRAPLVPILMGSSSDLPFSRRIAGALEALGVECELRVASAHKVPQRLLQLLAGYEASPRPKVYVAVAGRSNALSGVLAAAVAGPVVTCPPYSDKFAGADLFSSIRMPSGVASGLVLEPEEAALFVGKILGLIDPAVRERLQELQRDNRGRLFVDDAKIVSEGYLERIREAFRDRRVVKGVRWEGGEASIGKVRDRFEAKEGKELVLVTTDRQSAFDRVLAAVPFKGAVLNLTSAWWFGMTEHIVPNHVLDVPHPNVTIARKCRPFPVEFVMRQYITGSTETSLWKNYAAGVRNYCGLQLPEGLVKNEKLENAVLTPTTKDVQGDRPISPIDIVREGIMSAGDFEKCAKAARELFQFGQEVAEERGLILVDTKYEFGLDEEGVIRVIDEMHTPDSSRYWLKQSYRSRFAEGKEPENIDKEFLRLWFRERCDPYDKTKELPEAPEDLVTELSRRYVMLYEIITGKSFDFKDRAVWGDTAISEILEKYVGSKVESRV